MFHWGQLFLAILLIKTSSNWTQAASCSGTPDYGTFANVAVPSNFRHRGSWGASEFGCGCSEIVPMDPDQITIHHTATSSSTTVSHIQNNHQRTNGWCDIGYHFLVDTSGEIFQGRPFWDDPDVDTTPETSPEGQWPSMALIQGAHVGGANANNIGISLIGCFDSGSGCNGIRTSISTSSAQYLALLHLVAYLADQYGISVSSSTIKGHKDHSGANTACPGSSLHALIDDIITDANTMVDDACSVPNSFGGDNIRGVCIPTSECDDHRIYTSNYCPNHAWNVKCCHGKACKAYNSVSASCELTSTCDNLSSWYSVSSECPEDPANVKCCIRHTCESSTGVAGQCMSTSDCTGMTESGLCAGPTNIKCCYFP